LLRALNTEESPRDVIEIEPFDSPGERRTVMLHAEPIRDAIRNVVGSMMAKMAITAHVKMEAALRESEAKFRTIAVAMPQMVWSTLPNGMHDYYNQRWYDFTGISEGSADGEEWNGMFHPADRPNAWALWRHSLATGEIYEVQYRLRHHSGEYRWTRAAKGSAPALVVETGGPRRCFLCWEMRQSASFSDRSRAMIAPTHPISPLRQRMIDDMRMRKLAPKSQLMQRQCWPFFLSLMGIVWQWNTALAALSSGYRRNVRHVPARYWAARHGRHRLGAPAACDARW
jgi:PAS domain S-box-containing protein